MKNTKNFKNKPSSNPNSRNRDDKRGQKPRPNHRRDTKGEGKPTLKVDLFGVHAVTEAWANPKRHVHELYITDKALDGFDKALKLAHDRGLKRPAPQIIDKSALDSATPTGSVHQGIGLNCQPLEEIDIHDIARMEEAKDRSVLVMLDQVTDPHNVGAIIRSACVFGAGGMIMQRKHAPELRGTLAKTACGGVEHLPVAYETNLTRSIEALQEAGYFAVGLAEEGEASLASFKTHDKLLLVLGAEGDGLRRLVREQCDSLVALPTAGALSSLNVSNAAAVALYGVLN